MAMSDYLEQKLINHTYDGAAFSQPSTWYVALYNTDPTDADSGTEVTGGGYAATLVPTAGSSWSSSGASDYIVSNTNDIVFPTATGDWTTINYVAIFDGSDTGTANMLDYGAITTPRTVLTDGVFKILAGDLDIQYT